MSLVSFFPTIVLLVGVGAFGVVFATLVRVRRPIKLRFRVWFVEFEIETDSST